MGGVVEVLALRAGGDRVFSRAINNAVSSEPWEVEVGGELVCHMQDLLPLCLLRNCII